MAKKIKTVKKLVEEIDKYLGSETRVERLQKGERDRLAKKGNVEKKVKVIERKRRYLTNDEAAQFEAGMEFRPDWVSPWSVDQMETGVPFKFKGPGWYFEKGTKGTPRAETTFVTLVLPTENPDLWLFCAFNENNPVACFNWIVNAPVRVDER